MFAREFARRTCAFVADIDLIKHCAVRICTGALTLTPNQMRILGEAWPFAWFHQFMGSVERFLVRRELRDLAR